MQNPYQTLGVERNASPDEIKRAYRKLASQHHPDKGGDKNKFQDIQQAYDMLTDPRKRSAFDNPAGPGFGFQSAGPFDFQTIFDIFGTRFQQQHQHRVQQARMTLWITLTDLYTSQKKTISVATQAGTNTAEIDIPLGIDDGDTVQYSGLGPGGIDLLVTFRVHPDARFQRQGPNLITDQIVSIWDLILGADIIVRDPQGTNLALTLPPGTQPSTVFRLKARGLFQKNGNRGDLLVRVQARIPDHIPDQLLEQIRQNRND